MTYYQFRNVYMSLQSALSDVEFVLTVSYEPTIVQTIETLRKSIKGLESEYPIFTLQLSQPT